MPPFTRPGGLRPPRRITLVELSWFRVVCGVNHAKNDSHRPLRKVVAGDNFSKSRSSLETVACVNHAFFVVAAPFRKTARTRSPRV